MRPKNKGKVHPSPSPLPPPPDSLTVLKLLPTVILLLVSALSQEDKQVLAYLITRSLKTTTTTTNAKGRSSNKKSRSHKAHFFDCECFDCYMSYWLRWDSSPNRELIHQIIESFEDHLTNNEKNSQKPNGRGGKKSKDKSSRRRGKITESVVMASDEVKSTELLRSPVVAAGTGHKGLARKMLPDVMGLFNSRFWRLWNPNA